MEAGLHALGFHRAFRTVIKITLSVTDAVVYHCQ
jgi:hypothetical protein